MQLSQSEFDEWAKQPVSIALNEYLANEVKTVLQNLSYGTTNQPLEMIGAKTVAGRAQLHILQKLMEIKVEDLNDRNDK